MKQLSGWAWCGMVAVVVGCAGCDSKGNSVVEVDTNAVKKVGSEFGKAARTAAPEIKKIGSQLGNAARKAAPGVKKVAGNTATLISDETVTARVKTAIIGDDILDSSQINVDVKENKVILRGRVANMAQKNRAVSIAKRESAGYKLIDQLKVTK